MSTTATDSSSTPVTAVAASRGYRTLWRWHFYAGLFVMPFLVVLALTGTLYCFQPQIEPLLYPHRLVVEPRDVPRLAEDTLLANARQALPAGSLATTARISSRADRSAEFIFRLPNGEKQSLYLNPYDGTVLGTLSVEHRFMQIDRMIHRKLLLGKLGELLMELVACWTLVMIGSGIALWWPRAGTTLRGALVPRFTLRGRPLWKSMHAALGIWLAAGALAFVVTGLPWTGSWGKHFKSLSASVNLGSPPGSWGGLPLHSRLPRGAAQLSAVVGNAADSQKAGMDSMPGMTMDDLPLPQIPWAAGAATVPQSQDAAPTVWTLGRVVTQMRALGLPDDYDVALPASASGVYTVSYFPPDPKLERTVYIDQYSGAILKDIRYGDYGAVGKAVSYGTSLHMGRYFGLANQIVCAGLSLGLATLAFTGCVMWWKRRPAGTLGAPGRDRAIASMRGWKLALVLLGAVFPLMGVTLIAVWLADRMLSGRPLQPLAD
ncbi:PepSY-associated TM helix domain-containing protein [Paraburkholderia sp. MM5477-R1]|uniref:PepSY-associated TM helix domain-containing protein n=1 Tax=Paraburkholderia sp. MM5477-R1 TaxID=2991062 RepID=UPI003D1AE340